MKYSSRLKMRSYIGQSWNGGHLSYHVGWLKMGCFPQNLCISGLGSMHSCILYSCTRVHISEYSDVLYTHVLLAWYSVLVLEYIHKVLVLSEYISQYFSINNAIILIFDDIHVSIGLYTAALKHDVHYHLSGPCCILLLQPYSSIWTFWPHCLLQ